MLAVCIVCMSVCLYILYPECKEGLSYAPANAYCIEFKVIMKPSDKLAQYDGVRECLEENINTAIENGLLYEEVSGLSSSSSSRTQLITGLGSPGAGMAYEKSQKDVTESNTADDSNGPQGLSGWLIFVIILALFVLPLTILAVLRLRGRRAEEEARVREFAGEPARDTDLDLENPQPVAVAPVAEKGGEKEKDNDDDDDDSSAHSVWSEGGSKTDDDDVVDGENTNPDTAKVGSSLAAMGVASAVTTNMYEKKNDANEEEEEELHDLEAIKAEVVSLVEKTAPGKTAEELLSAYVGKEEELVAHLRRLYREQSRS